MGTEWISSYALERINSSAVLTSSELTLGGGHFLLSDLTFVCDGRDFFLSEVDIDFTSDPFSFGTRTNILERVQPDPSAPVEWVPVTSLRELDGRCGR